ncbi:MAG: GNAT family N-acetyltransferase [Myxococcales bacterium]|nr:GNAT family N-acetyltransferase [Myxococcales bacterium]
MRAAGDGDLDALARLWHEADELHARLSPGFFRRPDLERGRQRAFEALRDSDESQHEAILVALHKVDGKEVVCGACHLQIYDTPVGHTLVPQRRGHVETLIVARAQRRRGIGRALMAAATDWARRQGAHQLLLTVWAGNADAERFYAALGYRTISQVLGTDL